MGTGEDVGEAPVWFRVWTRERSGRGVRHERIYLGPPVSKRDAGIFQPNVERSRSACYKFCEVMFFFFGEECAAKFHGKYCAKSSSKIV